MLGGEENEEGDGLSYFNNSLFKEKKYGERDKERERMRWLLSF